LSLSYQNRGGLMRRLTTAVGLLIAGSVASPAPAAPQSTDFGVRLAPGTALSPFVGISGTRDPTQSSTAGPNLKLGAAVAVASSLGRVTSTIRTAARNRAVGGVRNSYHLRGRAIDVARKAGVRHSDIEAALRNAGFHLIESLDEGDHSHFAFGTGPARALSVGAEAVHRASATQWRIVTAPRIASR
jgi:hypothetical protein